ncbi:MAG: heme NO-binding domain-containing protein [Bacteroidota bacterium]
MYGIVNKAIEELVTENFGADKWELIKERSGVDVEMFISTEAYDDEVTFKLAVAASEEMGIGLNEVLMAFGEWWILRTGKEKYGYLLESGGANLKEFLIHLPLFHNRVSMIYPKLTPPEFKVSDIGDNILHLHYYSKRTGLKDFVMGLLSGLGKFYSCKVTAQIIESRDEGSDHEVFRVTWE